MRRGVLLLVLGTLTAALGAASAYAAGTTTTTTTTSTTATTTTSTTTTETTTTGTTTTAPPPPSYSRLTPSYLAAGCVGAGAVAIAEPGRQVLALGTPASSRGPSAYPANGSIVRFVYSTASGSACSSAHVALGSASLFGGAITATNIAATHGKGLAAGVRIYGSSVALRAGSPVRIGSWGEATLEKTVGRLTAPLVVQLLATHYGLPAGTTIALAFGASPQLAPESRAKAATNSARTKSTDKTRKQQLQPSKPPPDFPESASPLTMGGGLTKAAQENPIVAIAMRYLGVPYQWGGASPATGFDCSGLVQYVFAQFGIPLVHYAATQWHAPNSVWVPPTRLQAGDLVFFVGSDGTRKEPGHVGIYVNDGYFIDAPHTGSFVRVDSLTERKFANQYVGARRIVGASLDARHLLDETGSNLSAAAFRVGFQSRLAIDPVGALGAATGQAASPHDSYNTEAFAGSALGGLFLLGAGGAFLFRRRRAQEALPSSDPAD